MACTSCCLNCRSGRPGPSSRHAEDVYALEKLLKVGTVSIRLGDDAQPDTYCEHVHASDGWHPYGGTSSFLPLTSLSDVKLCQGLEFLVKHRFVDATYRVVGDRQLVIRVYFVPYDLAGTKGVLRNRKDGVLGPGRRYMRLLVPRLVSDWDGTGQVVEQGVIPTTKDRRTLAEIYSELASPQPKPVEGYGDISSRLLDDGDELDGLGLRSELYHYQRRSVAALMQRELDETSVPNPVYVSLMSIDGQAFFFQPGTMEVLLEKQMVSPCRGGILCEELGTGKTIMIIGLILATLKQLPRPEESLSDDRPIMTPLSFRHFPASECTLARTQFGIKTQPEGDRVPSLVELMLHRSRTAPDDGVPNLKTPQGRKRNERLALSEEHFENLPLAELRKAITPFYFNYRGEVFNNERPGSRRRRNDLAPKRMYISSATLVVVPANLLSQWDREILKHAEHPLRVLILRSKTAMPSVRELANDYDIILTTYTRFTAEANHKDVSKLYSWNPCQCPEIPGTRIPDCKCQVNGISPLLQIRWKRLVIDEGHVSATLSTILTPFTRLLSVERRWIVTGTPTTNLLGLGLGKRTIEESGMQMPGETIDDAGAPMDVDSHDTFIGGGANFDQSVPLGASTSTDSFPSNHSDTPSASGSSRTSPDPSVEQGVRIWNKYDREDLRKLGNMISYFIAVPQFASDPKLMSTHVTDPLLDYNGPRPGAIPVLSQIMDMVMIRHRVEDVEADVVLPPLTHESILLELDPLVIISYNALQAAIAINAVDSEKKDQDYLFHPANAEYLQATVRNMSQLMFWHVDEELFNVEQLHSQAQLHVNRALKRGVSASDVQLLKNALRHIAIAANDPLWKAAQHHEDVLYRVYSMPQSIYDAWRRTPGSHDSTDPSFVGFLHVDRLVKLYRMIKKKPLIKEDDIVQWGRVVAFKDAERRKAYIESQKKTQSRRQNQNQHESPAAHSQMADSAVKKATSKETLKEVQTELDYSMALLERAAVEDAESVPASPPDSPSKQTTPREHQSDLSRLALSSCLAPVRIGSSASSKLNYIVNEVMQYSATEKFLIFSDSELTLAHVAEALSLIHVRFMRFSTQIPAQFREQLILTFETSERYRVFLMELKHGARGLNLVSASRVIFCEPVWQADVESQAIKRVHRIGQTRPITVKTLAIKGTAEENMVARRHALHNSQDKLPKLIEEAGMRDFIANPRFMESPPQNTTSIKFPLIDLPPIETSLKLKIPKLPSAASTPTKKRVWVGDPLPSDDEGASPESGPAKSEPEKKRVRTIRFE